MARHPICSCIQCHSEITANNLKIHSNSKQCINGGKYIPKFVNIPDNFVCEKCGSFCYGKISYITHYIQCSGIFHTIGNTTKGKRNNQYTKPLEHGLPPKVVSCETKSKMSESHKNSQKTRWSQERRKTHSVKMRDVAKNNPHAYTSSNRGRVKEIEKYGIKFHGSWELIFYEWCINNNITIERNFSGFPYEYNGIRTYYPDFYLPCYDYYVEVKGYKVDKDIAKWSYFNNHLVLIQKYEIGLIKKGNFSINLVIDNLTADH